MCNMHKMKWMKTTSLILVLMIMFSLVGLEVPLVNSRADNVVEASYVQTFANEGGDDFPDWYGDVTNSGMVEVADAILVLRHVVNLIDLTIIEDYGIEAFERARVSGGVEDHGPVLRVTDAIFILRYVVGLIDNFPVDCEITTGANPDAGGTTSGHGNYDHNSSATVLAQPSAGYTFINWTVNDEEISSNPSYTFNVTGNWHLVANFAPEETECPEVMQARRLAANHLAMSSVDEKREGRNDAWLGEEAIPFYRPDLEGVAYYEFPVFEEREPVGYIMVSNGRHDHPVVNWNADGPPRSMVLDKLARENGEEVFRLYRLDDLYYVAEGRNGDKIASLGNPLVEVQGFEPEVLEYEGTYMAFTEFEGEVETEKLDDEDYKENDFKRRLVTEGESDPFEFKYADWPSWEEMKKDYGRAFKYQLKLLEDDAEKDWEIEDLVAEFGEGLHRGDRYPVPALYPLKDKVNVPEGAERYVSFDLEEREGAPPILWIDVNDVPEEEFVFDLAFEYANGLNETLRFALVDMSLVQGEASGLSNSAAEVTSSSWSPWNYYYAYPYNKASADADQRWYTQFDHDYGGGSIAPVGCGPVAWAMLFGWASYQAQPGRNPAWAPRRGIYRENGSYFPAPFAEAPKYITDVNEGEGIKHVIRELNRLLETRIFMGGGLTFVGNMENAEDYLRNVQTFTQLHAEGNPALFRRDKYRENASEVIKDEGNPVVVGVGKAPAHYCLAYGYRYRTRTVRHWAFWEKTEYQYEFYVNQGWGFGSNEWITAKAFFVGKIMP